MQGLELAELADLSLGLAHRRLIGQGFGHTLTIQLEGQPEVRAMPRIVGLVAVASGLSAAAPSSCDGAGSKITQGGDPRGQTEALLFEGFKGGRGRQRKDLFA